MLPRTGDVVIDGMRFPDDHAFLAEAFGPGFLHIHVQASDETRKSRFGRREGEAVRFEAATSHPVESAISRLAPLSHVVVQNEGEPDELYARIRDALNTERSEG